MVLGDEEDDFLNDTAEIGGNLIFVFVEVEVGKILFPGSGMIHPYINKVIIPLDLETEQIADAKHAQQAA